LLVAGTAAAAAAAAASHQMIDIGLLVFDEVHHCKSDHPYNQLMQVRQGTRLGGGGRSDTHGLLALGQESTSVRQQQHLL
jgi:hypothetical protein